MAHHLTRKLAGLVFACLGIFGGAAPVFAQALLKSAINVDPGNTKQTGATFGYRLTYNCSSTSGPCLSAQVVDLLPAEVQYISTVPASPTGDVAAINVTNNFGGSGRTRVQFVLITPLPAGNSGDLIINVRFPNGSTPNGTVAVNTADGINLGATPGTLTTPPVNVTAVAAVDVVLSKTLQTAPANLDLPETYRLRIANNSNNGDLNLTAIGPVVDTLPPGTVFNGATPAADCQPGCVGTTPATITWTSPCSVPLTPGNNCDIFVNVVFPSATFPSGTNVTNSFVVDATPLGEPPQSFGPGTITHPVTTFVPNPSMTLGKNMAGGTPNPPTLSQTFSYDINPNNNGNVPLDNLVIIDTLPVEIQVTSITTGAYNALTDFAPGEGVRVSYEKNTALGVFTLWGSSPNTTTNTTLTAPPPGLGAGEYLTRIRWEYGQAQVGMGPSTRPLITGRIINPDQAGGPVAFGDTIQNCVALSAVHTAGPTNVNQNACRSFTLSGPFVQFNPQKENLSGAGPFNPGQTVNWRLRVRSAAQSSDPVPLEFLEVTDLLPVDLVFTGWAFDDQGTGLPAPQNFIQTPNFAGTGRTLLRWNWNAGSGNLGVNQQVWINIGTTVRSGATNGTLTNTMTLEHDAPGLTQRCSGSNAADVLDVDADGNTAETLCTASGTAVVAPIAQLISSKEVQSVCDTGFAGGLAGGETLAGAEVLYRLRVQNVGTVAMQNFVLVDILPFVGDTGVRDTNPRNSTWQIDLVAPIDPPPGTAVYYSTSGNPCRGEVGGPTTSCDPPNWSTAAPEPISSARSFKIEFGSRVIAPFDFLEFALPLHAPALVPGAGAAAFNSFAYQADRSDGLGSLAAEPQKVGTVLGTCSIPASLGNYVWVDSNANGLQDDGQTGVNGVYVELFNIGVDGVPGTLDDVPVHVGATQTDSGGNPGWYDFPNLDPATYYVCFSPPANYVPTLANVGGNDAIDSDPDRVTQCTPPVFLAAGEINPTLDLGLVQIAALGNYVWFDRNSDGVQNESPDDGANGVTVRLFADDGDGVCEVPPQDVEVASTLTADDVFGQPGYYEFSQLIPGQPYCVRFIRPNVSTAFTTRNVGDDALDSDANLADGYAPVVTLAPAEFNRTIDAGLIAAAGTLALGDVVWLDSDNDGVYEPQNGELGIDGVDLSLYRDSDADGLADVDEYLRTTATLTNSGFPGRYRFDQLAAGNYIVVVESSNYSFGAPLFGLSTSTGNDPAPDPDDDVNTDDNGTQIGAVMQSLPVTLSAAGEPTIEDGDNNTNMTVDFGFFAAVPMAFDYGDLPDAGAGVGFHNYRTLGLDQGPSHQLGVVNAPFLGSCVDGEQGTAQNLDASLDDLSGGAPIVGVCSGNDDEDGVIATLPMQRGAVATISVNAGGPSACTLNAWADWNADGDFGDTGEQIATSMNVPAGPPTVLSPAVPALAADRVYARFRCASVGGLAPDGAAADGEVEDYVFDVASFDLGDLPASYATQGVGAARHAVNPLDAVYLGACVDFEGDGQPGTPATGDDLNAGNGRVGLCFDDEDGVTLPATFASCGTIAATVVASEGARLDAWFDWNRDGDVLDGGEQVMTSTLLNAGSNNLNINVPCTSGIGQTYARFRLSTAGGVGPGGDAADGEVEDYAITGFGVDLGDAPAPFATLNGSGGAIHTIDPLTTLYLGACVDTEADGQPTAGATGDDSGAGTGTVGVCAVANDDEDSVVFAPVIACQTSTLSITANAAGMLDAWIDWNRDGDWGDVGEQLADNQNLAAGANALVANAPCNLNPGTANVRLRLSTAGVVGPGGSAPDGEIEDHQVTLRGADFGDAPDSFGTTVVATGASHGVDTSDTLYLGVCVDTESDGQAGVAANGDDLGAGSSSAGTCSGNDDENGVTFPTPIAACNAASITIVTAEAGLLDAWIDYNGDGDFDLPAEQIADNIGLVSGSNNYGILAVPCTAVPGARHARFRFSSAGVAGPTGAAPDGEVEDYVVNVLGVDFGDAPDTASTLIASNGPRHTIDPLSTLYLGACVDTEIDGQAGANANGDDLGAGNSAAGICAGNDDEDGVVFNGTFTSCKSSVLTITANAAGRLDAWMDFSGDGDFGDASEQIFTNIALTTGANPLNVAVPCDSAGGNKLSRFRFSSVGGLGIIGAATDGEVEDHLIAGTQEGDQGDAPDTYQTLRASNGPLHGVGPAATLFLGACVDTESNGAASADALGDDSGIGSLISGICTVANDDEDGVVFNTPVVACQGAGVTVSASIAGRLDAWIDWNRDGDFADANERIANNLALAAGANALTPNVPCSVTAGLTFSRFRFSDTGGLDIGGTTPAGEVEDHSLQLRVSDLGDAPDSYGTTFAANGPSHGIVAGFSLGATVDSESDGQPNTAASGDGADEDGVTLPSGNLFTACDTIAVPVALTNTAAIAVPMLDAWIDFDGDGAFNDPRDRVASALALVSGSNSLSVNVPCDVSSRSTYARFRLSDGGIATPTAGDPEGEVEDYAVTLAGQDYGDAPDPTYPTLFASNGARHPIVPVNNPQLGATVDTEPNGQPNAGANGDGSDEDGVVFPIQPMVPGTNAAIRLTAGPTGGVVSCWIDFNIDGDWGDAGEQVVTDLALAAAAVNTQTFPVTVGSPQGATYSRCRISTATGLGITGAAPDGEIEDHRVGLGEEAPEIALSKRVSILNPIDAGTYQLGYQLVVVNTGNVPLTSVQVVDDLNVTFPGALGIVVQSLTATGVTPNAAYNGSSDTNMLAAGNTLALGASGTIDLLLRVMPGQGLGPYLNSATASGLSPEGDPVVDISQDGSDPDPDGNGDPGDDGDPTPVVFPPFSVPAMGMLGMLMMGILLMLMAAMVMRRRADAGAA